MRAPHRLTVLFVAFNSLAACGASAPAPAPAADAATTLATICANLARRSCGGPMCERDIRASYDSIPERCSAPRDAYFACAARSTATGCLSNDATFLMCAAQSDALSRCVGPVDAGRPADPPMPADASTPDDARG